MIPNNVEKSLLPPSRSQYDSGGDIFRYPLAEHRQ